MNVYKRLTLSFYIDYYNISEINLQIYRNIIFNIRLFSINFSLILLFITDLSFCLNNFVCFKILFMLIIKMKS